MPADKQPEGNAMRIWFIFILLSSSVFAAQISDVSSSDDKGFKEIKVLHQVDELAEPLAFEDTICLLRDAREVTESCAKPVRILRKSRGWNEFVLKLPKSVADFSEGDKVVLQMKRTFGGGRSVVTRRTSGLAAREEIAGSTTTKKTRISRSSVRRRLSSDAGNRGRIFNIAAGGAVVGYKNFVSYAFQLPMQLAISPEFAIGITPLFIKQSVLDTDISGYGGFGTFTIHFNKFFDGARLQAGAGYVMLKATANVIESETNTFAGFGTIGFSHATNSGFSIDVGLGALYLANVVNTRVTIPENILGYGTVALGFTF